MSGESGAEVTAQNRGFQELCSRSIWRGVALSPLGGFLRLLPGISLVG